MAASDFFISYNKADRAWAEWQGWQLEAAGYTIIVQAWDFRPGNNFVAEMQRATTSATRTIAVLSPDYLNDAPYSAAEWNAAFVNDPTGKNATLLPVRVRECDPPGLLKAIIYIDLVTLDEQAACDAFLAGINKTRAKPTKPNHPHSQAHASRHQLPRPTFPASGPCNGAFPITAIPSSLGARICCNPCATSFSAATPWP